MSGCQRDYYMYLGNMHPASLRRRRRALQQQQQIYHLCSEHEAIVLCLTAETFQLGLQRTTPLHVRHTD